MRPKAVNHGDGEIAKCWENHPPVYITSWFEPC